MLHLDDTQAEQAFAADRAEMHRLARLRCDHRASPCEACWWSAIFEFYGVGQESGPAGSPAYPNPLRASLPETSRA